MDNFSMFVGGGVETNWGPTAASLPPPGPGLAERAQARKFPGTCLGPCPNFLFRLKTPKLFAGCWGRKKCKTGFSSNPPQTPSPKLEGKR